MDISIIIVNYNTKEDLINCLESVYRAQAGLKIQTIVIDNNSKDGSAEMVETSFPDVELIANKDNVGFVAASNQGIRHAKGRYILLLNPDTILFEDTLEKSVEYMDARPDVGCLGIKTLTAKGNIFPNGNTFPSEIKTLARLLMLREILPNKWIRKRLPHIMGKVASAYADREQEREVDMVGGFYLFLRADAVKQAGELEEAYWADIEDSDYCCMLKKAGWKVVYWPGASMIHLIGSSIERRTFSLDTYLRVNENTMLFFKRHYPARRLLALRAIYVFGVLPQILIALLLPVCLGSEKAQTFTRIKGALVLAKSALILPERIRYAR
ncbi:MAG: glycosyltransferase family 2 protein [Deltaproteobacteria bacterium]|nr:glycosyltransferase family 2 protein [Deltaproteobacteria bacterium]